jgi:hypothetical protein
MMMMMLMMMMMMMMTIVMTMMFKSRKEDGDNCCLPFSLSSSLDSSESDSSPELSSSELPSSRISEMKKSLLIFYSNNKSGLMSIMTLIRFAHKPKLHNTQSPHQHT